MSFRITVPPGQLNMSQRRVRVYYLFMVAGPQEIMRRLAGIGANEIDAAFRGVAYAGDGTFTVGVALTPTGCVLHVSGKAIMFMEFGAGVTLGTGYPGTKPAGVSAIGTFGKGLGANPKGWWFTGASGSEHTLGNAPAAGVYRAAKEMRSRVAHVGQTVFNEFLRFL